VPIKYKIILAVLAILTAVAVFNRFTREDAKKSPREEVTVGGFAELASRPGDDALSALASLRSQRTKQTAPEKAIIQTPMPTAAPQIDAAHEIPTASPKPIMSSSSERSVERILPTATPTAAAAPDGASRRERELIEQVMMLQQEKAALQSELEEDQTKLAVAARNAREESEKSRKDWENTNTRSLTELKQKLSFAEARIGDLERELKSATAEGAQSGNLSTQLRSLEERFRELQTREAERVENLKTAEAQNASLRVELKEATDKLSSLLRLSKSNEDEAKAQRRVLEESKTQLTAANQTSADLKQQLQEALAKLKDKSSLAAEAVGKLEKSEAAKAELTKKVDTLTAENGQRKKLLEDTTNQLNDKATKLAEIAPKLEAREKELKELAARLSAAETLGEKVKAVQSELLAVRNELLLAHEQLRALGVKPAVSTVAFPTPTPEPTMPPPVAAVEKPERKEAIPAEIAEDKTALYLKADVNSPIVMKLDKGARVIITSSGKDWTKVEAPTGGTAFVKTSQVRKVAGDRSAVSGDPAKPLPPEPALPGSTAVQPSDDSSNAAVDDELKAFEQLKHGMQKK
jgi:chromosome segregation ATPase